MYHTVGSVPNSNRKITGRSTIDTLSTEIQDHSFSCLGTDTSIKSDRVKQLYGPK